MNDFWCFDSIFSYIFVLLKKTSKLIFKYGLKDKNVTAPKRLNHSKMIKFSVVLIDMKIVNEVRKEYHILTCTERELAC